MAAVDLDAVSTRLKALRARLSLTQNEVAWEIGIPPRTFWGWENGVNETNGDNYDLIAAYYSEKLNEEITRDWILFGHVSAVDGLPRDLKNYIASEVAALRETLRTELLAELERAFPPHGNVRSN